MKKNHLQKVIFSERSEEIEDIIERIPTDFSYKLSAISIFLFSTLFFLGWYIKYPEVITGQITVSTTTSPIKLVANTNGRIVIKSNIQSQHFVKKGDIIAYLDNSTKIQDIARIDSINRRFSTDRKSLFSLYQSLPDHISLGELNTSYYNFKSVVQDLFNFKFDDIYHKRLNYLTDLLNKQKVAVNISKSKVDVSLKYMSVVKKFYSRDSILFHSKVISQAEMDKRELEYLSAKDTYQNAISTLVYSQKEVQITENQITDLNILEPEKERMLDYALISSFNTLNDEIKRWKQRYVFIAPFDGTVQFLKFYENNQFVEAGEKVFSIIPTNRKTIGRVLLPTVGSGKIKIGQDVIIKLDDYPFMEYGTIKGTVSDLSLTSGTTKIPNGELDTYLLTINLPNGLRTKYDKQLHLSGEIKGSAEIVVKDRRLINRLFENLKYFFSN